MSAVPVMCLGGQVSEGVSPLSDCYRSTNKASDLDQVRVPMGPGVYSDGMRRTFGLATMVPELHGLPFQFPGAKNRASVTCARTEQNTPILTRKRGCGPIHSVRETISMLIASF